MSTWYSDEPPHEEPISAVGWMRIAWRGPVMVVNTFGALLVLLALRAVEAPIFGRRRPWTPFVAQFGCRMNLRILGITPQVEGRAMVEPGAIVANHASWLDIFSLHAFARVYFVAKSEVANWPGIGWLARATGTLFITRDPRHAALQRTEFRDRLKLGHKLLFFPEGTSTDSRRVLQFKTTLFAAFFDYDLAPFTAIQPVSLVYLPPQGKEPRFYGWWGDMSFDENLLKILAAKGGGVKIIFHPALKVADFADRKALALAAEQAVRGPILAAQSAR
jgi:1-acyl-sn-glycerol-3-phosphate acyltransferase